MRPSSSAPSSSSRPAPTSLWTHPAIVARRTGIPDTLIALITAGAEWEELAVVVSALAQGRASLALGNIVGSAISKHPRRLFAGACILLASAARRDDCHWSPTLVAFVIYLLSIGWAINRGTLVTPEGSDSGSYSDEDDTSSLSSDSSISTRGDDRAPTPSSSQAEPQTTDTDGEQQPLLRPSERFLRRRRGLSYHFAYLLAGFLAICLAGYILSHEATNIADALGASDVLFGIVVLAIGTTLPEKFIAVISGRRGHGGILVANTVVGGNVFLLTVCLGIYRHGGHGGGTGKRGERLGC
ncbi:hypothetical protein CSAL01_11792 [Colletotrichum salicis]|uniref:Sodium/calcium exchanger membrane region domain-containing protein n=1 Tax=Colletotrichum salicis TaxID=1209931 RepID=A0A135U609_9PEZI|nr:hypothetical protein CSAL01_11792 [Colletotrichum salicis]